MTSVFEDPSGDIIVFTKGADSVLFPLCALGQDELKKKTQEYMDEYAKEGLRTLLLAQKRMNRPEYNAWHRQHEEASLCVNDRDE